jgi:phosphate transport system protein
MPREILDRHIRKLLDELLLLGSMVEGSTLGAVEALRNRDLEACKLYYFEDRLINQKRFEIENAVITTLATQQPIMAGDLRMLASILEVTSEIERMGDYAKGVAKIGLMLGNEPLIKPLIDIPRMAELAVDMLHRALGAFVSGDVATAQKIPEEDDLVDTLYNQVYQELAGLIAQNPANTDQANVLLWAAHNMERLADRVTNICERTIYTVSGHLQEIIDPDDEIIDLDKRHSDN